MDGSLNGVTLRELGSLELPLQLCCKLEVPLCGQYALFFRAYCPNRAPQGHRPHFCVLLIRCLFVPNIGSSWESVWAVWLDTWAMETSGIHSSCTSQK